MIALAAFALLATTQTKSVSLNLIGISGGSLAQAKELAKYLGPTYSVSRWNRNHDSLVISGVVPMDPITIHRAHLSMVYLPDLTYYKPYPEWYVDGLKSEIRSDAVSFRKDVAAFKQFLCVPAAPKGSPSADRRLFEVFLAPLTRQAAREAGVPTIEVPVGSSAIEAIADAIQDPRIEKKDWRLVSADSEETDEGPAANAIDGNPDSYWHTRYDPTLAKYPHQITVDMGKVETINGFRYLPRQDGGVNGRVKAYELFLSTDGRNWASPVVAGDLPNTNKPTRVAFPITTARYFRFVAKSEQNGGPWATAAEIDVLRVRP